MREFTNILDEIRIVHEALREFTDIFDTRTVQGALWANLLP